MVGFALLTTIVIITEVHLWCSSLFIVDTTTTYPVKSHKVGL